MMARMPALAAATLIAFQGVGASITGVVRDGATGDPIAGAEVVLPDLGRTAVTGPALHLLVPASGVLRVDLTLSAAPIEVAAVVAHARVPVPVSPTRQAGPPGRHGPGGRRTPPCPRVH